MRPRLEDVARLAGVSPKSVSNVVHGAPHVSEELRARVRSAIEELGYRPNEAARSLKAGGTGVVAVIVPVSGGPDGFAEALAAEGERRGLRVVVVPCGADPAAAFELLHER